MAVKAFYDRARRTIVEIVEGGKSWLRYRGNDKLFHYIKTYDSPDGGGGDDIQLKTINSESLKGTGNITLVSSVKTINGETMTGTGNVSTQVPVVTVSGATPTQELAPNTFYKFGTVDSLTLTMALPTFGILNIYSYSFTASSSFDASTSTYLPDGVTLNGDFAIEEGQTCEISIQDGRAAFMVWDAPEVESPDAPGEPVVDG